MTAWRFADPEGGEYWLRDPLHAFIHVDYRSKRTGGWRRVGIATRSWVGEVLDGVRVGKSGPLCAAIPSVFIVPDAAGEELRSFVDHVVQSAAVDLYSTPIEGANETP